MTVHDNKFLSFEFHLNSFCGNAQQHFYSTNKKHLVVDVILTWHYNIFIYLNGYI